MSTYHLKSFCGSREKSFSCLWLFKLVLADLFVGAGIGFDAGVWVHGVNKVVHTYYLIILSIRIAALGGASRTDWEVYRAIRDERTARGTR